MRVSSRLDGPVADELIETGPDADDRSDEARAIRLVRDPKLRVVFAVSLIAVLAVPSVTPVFPRLAEELGIGGAQVGLLITFFALPGVILAPFFGLLADRMGRRRVLVPSLVLFAMAGTACTFTRDFRTLLLLRAIQGIGGASLGSLSLTLIGDLYSGRKRAAAIGLNGSVISIGSAVYPAVGGVVAIIGIYYPFALAALALPVGLMVLTQLDDVAPGSLGGVREQLSDVVGCVLNRSVLGFFLAGLLTMVLFYGTYLTYLSLLMGERFAASPALIGLITSAMPVGFALASSQHGRIIGRVSIPTVISTSFAVYALAIGLMPFMSAPWMLVFPAALFGLAHGANIPAQQLGLVGLAPSEHRGAFMSLNTTIIRGGQTVGPLLVGLFYLLGGLNGAFLASAALAFIVSVISFAIHHHGGVAA